MKHYAHQILSFAKPPREEEEAILADFWLTDAAFLVLLATPRLRAAPAWR